MSGQKYEGEVKKKIPSLESLRQGQMGVAHAFNPSTQEADTSGSLSSRTAMATEKSCLRKRTTKKSLSLLLD